MNRDSKVIFDKAWSYLLKLLDKEVRQSNESKVSKRIGVYPGTVGRWLAGDRGESVTLRNAIRIIFSLGGTMAELMEELGEETAAGVLQLLMDDPEFIQGILEIMHAHGPEAEKLRQDVLFLRTVLESKRK